MAAPWQVYFVNGWEAGNDNLARATLNGLVVTSGGGVPRTGTYSARCNTSGISGRWSEYAALSAAGKIGGEFGRTAETFYAVYIKATTWPTAGTPSEIVSVRDSAGNIVVAVNITSAGALTLVGTTTSGTVATLSTGTWYRLQLRVNSNGPCGLTVDAGSETTVTGNNRTQDRIRLGLTAVTTADMYYDDLAVSSIAFLAHAVRLSKPVTDTGMVTTGGSDWTRSSGTSDYYTYVDEIPNTGATDYWQSRNTTALQYRLLVLQSAATIGVTDTIACVQVQAFIAEAAAAATEGGTMMRSSGTSLTTTAGDIGSTGYFPITLHSAEDPATGEAWTTGAFDALQVGPFQQNVGAQLRCTAILMQVLDAVTPIVVTPPNATLTATGQVPTVTATNHKLVTPPNATLTATGQAPTVTATDHKLVTPPNATLTATGQVPTVAVTNNQRVTPDAASLVATGYAPDVAVTDHKLMTPGAAALVATGQVPDVVAGGFAAVTPDAAALVLAGAAPDVVVTDHKLMTPDAAALVATGQVPDVAVSDNQRVTPDAAALVATGQVPDVAVSDNQRVTPDAAALALTGQVPDVLLPVVVSPGLYLDNPEFEVDTAGWAVRQGTETLTRDTSWAHAGAASGRLDLTAASGGEGAYQPFAPSVGDWARFDVWVRPDAGVIVSAYLWDSVSGFTQGDSATGDGTTEFLLSAMARIASSTARVYVRVGNAGQAGKSVWFDSAGLAQVMRLTAYSPDVTATANVAPTPDAASLVLTGHEPTVAAYQGVTTMPDAAALVVTPYAPDVAVTEHVLITPDAAALVATPQAPTLGITADVAPTPDAAALVLTGAAPTVLTPVAVTPDAAALAAVPAVPDVLVSDNQLFAPAAAALALTGAAPDVVITDHQLFAPDAAALALTGAAPDVIVTAHVFPTPDAAALVLTGYPPEVLTPLVVTPDAQSMAITAYAPDVVVTAHVFPTPDAAALVLTGYPPEVVAGASVFPTPEAATLVLTPWAPTTTARTVRSFVIRARYWAPENRVRTVPAPVQARYATGTINLGSRR